MPTYDVHAHTVPAGLVETLERDGHRYGTEVVEVGGRRAVRFAGGPTSAPWPAHIDDPAHRLAAMDAARVDVQLLSSWIDLTAYALPAGLGARYARMFNELLASTAAAAPDRYRALATVPLQEPAAAAAELRHAVTELGMVGVEIATTVDGRDLDDRDLDPFWAAAAELGCPVLVHPYQALAGRDVSRYFLWNLVGNPAESTIAVAHLVFGGVLDRHPRLVPVVVHGGGFTPFQAGRWERGFSAAAGLTGGAVATPPRELLRRVHFDTVLHDPLALAFLVRWAGADRVVLGSDYPFPMGDPRPVDTLEQVPDLGEADRQAILGGNVERLLAGIRR